MKWHTMIAVMMTVLMSQASAQQNAQQISAIVVKEPVFQTNGPYKVQEMMEPSLARHTVYRPIDLKAVKEKLPILAFGNGGCSMIGNAFETYLTEIASYGFPVIASGQIQPTFPPEGRPLLREKQGESGQIDLPVVHLGFTEIRIDGGGQFEAWVML